jgi:hypothetical protein
VELGVRLVVDPAAVVLHLEIVERLKQEVAFLLELTTRVAVA